MSQHMTDWLGLVERLRLRTLVQHSGPRGMDYGWNLQEHDSELHRDAAAELVRLAAALDAVQSVAAGMHASKISMLEAEIERLRAALVSVHSHAGWHADDDADPCDLSPDDMHSHVNGLIGQECAKALKPNVRANPAAEGSPAQRSGA